MQLFADEGGPPPPRRRSQRQREYSYVYQNKNERPGHKERPVESTARVQSKCASLWLLCSHYSMPAHGVACPCKSPGDLHHFC